MKIFNLILILFLIGACTTGRLVVDSSPKEAQVFVRAAGQSKSQSLGASPTSRSVSEVQDLVGGNNTIVVELRKNGYLPKSILVTDIDSLSDINVNFELSTVEQFISGSDPNMEETQRTILSRINEKRTLSTNQLIDDLFEAQRLVQVGRIEDSEKKLLEIESKHSGIASIYEIRGGIAFMKKDYKKALDAYRKAARANPKNLEILNMKKYLEENLGAGSRDVSGESQ